ncbi:MAG: CocE/NonD family hydrolase [Thermoplasmatota archaeon]
MRVVWVVVALVFSGCLTEDGTSDDATDDGAAGFTDTAVFSGDYDTEVMRTLTQGPFGIGASEAVVLESALDGVDIEMLVVRPDSSEPVPVVLIASPYFFPFVDLQNDPEAWMVAWEEDLLSHGYAWAYLSVRGTAGSGGCNDMVGHAERHDIDQAITWLGTQDWSNGHVGMVGGSYDANTQWAAASMGNPYLKTIVPLAGAPSNYHEFVHNGSVKAWTPAQYFGFYWLVYGSGALGAADGHDRTLGHTVELATCPGAVDHLVGSTETFLTSETGSTGIWEERDYQDEVVANYDGSIFLISGLQDITVEPHGVFPFMDRLEAKGLAIKYLVGPWGHENAWRADQAEMLLRWMDRWLKGDETIDLGPKALAMDTNGGWRAEPMWPPADANPLALGLCEGTLCPEPAGGSAMLLPTAPTQDPVEYADRFNGIWRQWDQPTGTLCPTCPTFTTGPLDEPLVFAGSPRLHLAVTPQGPGGHLTALLHQVGADGVAVRVGQAIMDLRFHDGGQEPQAVTPGSALVAKMQFQPLDVHVPAGSELVLTIEQGGYGVRWPTLPTYPIELDYAGSTLVLDVIARASDGYHDAPARVGPEGPPR